MSRAQDKFIEQIGLVDQIISIHGKLQTGRGRRHEQDALHRAGVVLMVAAWQAYIERVLTEGLDVISDSLNDPAALTPVWTLQAFKMRKAQIMIFVKKFNTPDDVKVRDLFQESLGFDVWSVWGWNNGPRQWDSKEVRKRTNSWVLVRHSIAHGFDLPNDVIWLQGSNGAPRLTLGLLKECQRHFKHLVAKTDSAFSQHLASEFGVFPPW